MIIRFMNSENNQEQQPWYRRLRVTFTCSQLFTAYLTAFVSLPSGSRSSGSTRSEGERRRSSKGPGSTVGGGEKSPSAGGVEAGGADSRSGSGSESEYSTRSSLRRGHGSAAPSEHSHASSQRSHHHRMPQPPHMSPYPPGILPYNPMMVMMVPQHPHPAMATAHALPHAQQLPTAPMHPALPPAPSSTPGGPPGAPPTRDLGSVPPELTASRQSFHLAMGNPSEFFVDVMQCFCLGVERPFM